MIMSTTHKPDVLRTHPTNKGREVLATVLALPAILLTVYVVWGIFDFATKTYIEAEVLTVRLIIVAAGLLTMLAWAGVIALHKSARRDLRSAPRRFLLTSMLAAFALSVLAMVGLPGWMSIGAFGLAVVAGASSLVAAARM